MSAWPAATAAWYSQESNAAYNSEEVWQCGSQALSALAPLVDV
jgi:hypothetical protein